MSCHETAACGIPDIRRSRSNSTSGDRKIRLPNFHCSSPLVGSEGGSSRHFVISRIIVRSGAGACHELLTIRSSSAASALPRKRRAADAVRNRRRPDDWIPRRRKSGRSAPGGWMRDLSHRAEESRNGFGPAAPRPAVRDARREQAVARSERSRRPLNHHALCRDRPRDRSSCRPSRH